MSSSIITPTSEVHMVSSGGDVAIPCREIDAHSTEEEYSLAIVSQKAKAEPSTGVHAPQSNQEGSVSAITREDVLQTPDSSVSVLRTGQIGNTSFAIRERVLDDGYNWRKYGQKNVKGNEYIRSYYRCTHPSCQVKKQLDCSSDGKVTDTVYFGHHNHAKPQQDAPLAVGFAVSILEGKPDDQSSSKPAEGKSPSQLDPPLLQIEPPVNHVFPTVAESVKIKDADAFHEKSPRTRDETNKDDNLDSKRKKRKCNVEVNAVEKYSGEHRAVVQTASDVDIVNDGYRWRKYGQKMVKGSPHPRNYYRCSSPGCPVKKHVERASRDPKIVVTTYEGTHDHDMPPSRTVTPKAAGSNISPTVHAGKTGSKSEEYDVHGLSKSGHSILSPKTKVVESQNGKSKTKLEASEGLGSSVIASSSLCEIRPNEDKTEKMGAKSKPNEQSGSTSKNGDVDVSVASAQSNAGLDSESSGQLNNKSRESDVVNTVSVVRPGIEGNCNDQQRANSEAIKS